MNSLVFDISKDQWLSRQLKTNTFSVKMQPAAVINKDQFEGPECLESILKQSPVFVYAKCPVANTQAVAKLEKFGFSLIDTNIVLQKKIRRRKYIKSKDIREAEPVDEKEVTLLARKNFLFSRFHLDCAFNKKTANAIKAAWTKSFFLGRRGDFMVVAQPEGKIAGFLQLLVDKPNKTLIIDLIATDKSMQGKGIASSMISFAENYFRNLNYIKVGTQIANLPSLKLYEALGFSIYSASYVLHYHNRQLGD